MSFTDTPIPTEAEQILAKLDQVNDRLAQLTEAYNGLGENQQWLVDNVKGIFQMFSSPQFMGQMMGALGNGGLSFPGPGGAAGDRPEGSEPPGE
jgi:hypothetical protein